MAELKASESVQIIPVTQTTEYLLGSLQAELIETRKDNLEIRKELHTVNLQLKEVMGFINASKGGWKVIATLGVFIGTVGGLIGAFADKLFSGG